MNGEDCYSGGSEVRSWRRILIQDLSLFEHFTQTSTSSIPIEVHIMTDLKERLAQLRRQQENPALRPSSSKWVSILSTLSFSLLALLLVFGSGLNQPISTFIHLFSAATQTNRIRSRLLSLFVFDLQRSFISRHLLLGHRFSLRISFKSSQSILCPSRLCKIYRSGERHSKYEPSFPSWFQLPPGFQRLCG